jgi:hypothetical protein
MDIHSGGYDLKFPHHDNEIAQASMWMKRLSCQFAIYITSGFGSEFVANSSFLKLKLRFINYAGFLKQLEELLEFDKSVM